MTDERPGFAGWTAFTRSAARDARRAPWTLRNAIQWRREVLQTGARDAAFTLVALDILEGLA